MHALGPYELETANIESYLNYSTTQPSGSIRAPTAPQVCWALEQHMDELAEALGLDPVELRLRTLVVDIGGTNMRVGLIKLKLKNKEVAKAEGARFHFLHGSSADCRKDIVIRGALESRKIEWTKLDDRPRVEVFERLLNPPPPPPVTQSLHALHNAHFGVAGGLGVLEQLLDSHVAFVREYLRPWEEAIAAVVCHYLVRGVIVKWNALETVDRLFRRFRTNRVNAGPFIA